MKGDPGLIAWVAEALEPVGTVSGRAMMGVTALYCDGAIFAIVDGDALWLKSDAESAAEWDAAGAERFSFVGKDGRTVSNSYRRAPGDVHDDPDAMRRWGALAVAAGRRKSMPKRKR